MSTFLCHLTFFSPSSLPPPEREQQQVHRDEDIARQLQHQFDNKRLEEERDAELARQLQQQMGQPPSAPHDSNTQPLVSDFERDAQLAERLQEEERFRERGLSASSPPPHVTESDAELARRLQMEEDRSSAMKHKQKGVMPSNEFTYGSSYSHSPGSNTYAASYNEPPVQYNNNSRARGGYGYEESHTTPYSVHSNPYNPLYGDDEQPRSKTPPPTRLQKSKNLRGTKSEDLPYKGEEEKIPCQFCQKLISFAQIMYHQVYCCVELFKIAYQVLEFKFLYAVFTTCVFPPKQYSFEFHADLATFCFPFPNRSSAQLTTILPPPPRDTLSSTTWRHSSERTLPMRRPLQVTPLCWPVCLSTCPAREVSGTKTRQWSGYLATSSIKPDFSLSVFKPTTSTSTQTKDDNCSKLCRECVVPRPGKSRGTVSGIKVVASLLAPAPREKEFSDTNFEIGKVLPMFQLNASVNRINQNVSKVFLISKLVSENSFPS